MIKPKDYNIESSTICWDNCLVKVSPLGKIAQVWALRAERIMR